MSRPRHRKKPVRKNKPAEEEIAEVQGADDLPTLEPVDELEPAEDSESLPELEPADDLEMLADDDAVKVRCQPSTDNAFDTEVHVVVPEMDKKDVPDAVRGPLTNLAARSAAALRYKRVVVDFEGEANIGTATKNLVGDLLVPSKPLKLVVRRGYGDELLHEGKLPTADVSIREDGNDLRVRIDGGDLAVDELKVALEPTIARLLTEARGKSVVVYCDGKCHDAPGLRDLLRAKLRDAGADKAHFGDTMLFDRTLENRVRFSAGQGVTTIQITPAEEDQQTIAALDMMLQPASKGFANQKLAVQFVGRAPRPAELDRAMQLCTLAKPDRVEVTFPGEGPQLFWPRLLELNRADSGFIEMRVKQNGRTPQAVLATFTRECAALTPKLVSQRITVLWPTDFPFDAEAERVMIEALEAHAPRNVGCTFGDDRREPFWPTPVDIDTSAGVVVKIDGETGKPPELARALERRLRLHTEKLRGQAVRVEMQGGGNWSRTLLRTLRDEAMRAGVTRLEVNDAGTLDLILPGLLNVQSTGKDSATIVLAAGGRSGTAVDAALQRELETTELPAKLAATIDAGAFTDQLTAALVARGAAKVILAGERPVQVHPPLFTAGRNGAQLTLRANPAGDDAAVLAQVDREIPVILARGDLATTTITLSWPNAKDLDQGPLRAALEKLTAAKPNKLLFDAGHGKPRQIYPEVVLDYVTVLGRKSDEQAPVVMLGIDAGSGEAHLNKVIAKLESMGHELDGKRVLLVVRHEGQDLTVPSSEPMFAQVCRFVAARAAATLTFAGLHPGVRRPHFVALQSKVPGVRRGQRFADPRFKRPTAPVAAGAATPPPLTLEDTPDPDPVVAELDLPDPESESPSNKD